MPPDFSALKINGKRASDLKRDGREVTLQPRAIEIKKIRIISIDIDKGTIHMQVSCSKGTYIRSLARDIGNQLDVGAHVQSLKRLSSGEFNLADAISIDELESYSSGNNLQKEIKIDPICGFSDYSIVIVNNFAIEKIKHGSQFSMKDVIKIEQNAKKLFTIQNEKKNLIAIADIDTENWHIVYKNVLL